MKDRWADLVVNPEDIVAIRAKYSSDPNPSFDQSIDQIQQRIKQGNIESENTSKTTIQEKKILYWRIFPKFIQELIITWK